MMGGLRNKTTNEKSDADNTNSYFYILSIRACTSNFIDFVKWKLDGVDAKFLS